MNTENLPVLKIHKLSQAQYDRESDAGRIDETALYLTPAGVEEGEWNLRNYGSVIGDGSYRKYDNGLIEGHCSVEITHTGMLYDTSPLLDGHYLLEGFVAFPLELACVPAVTVTSMGNNSNLCVVGNTNENGVTVSIHTPNGGIRDVTEAVNISFIGMWK